MICKHCGQTLANNDDATDHAGKCPTLQYASQVVVDALTPAQKRAALLTTILAPNEWEHPQDTFQRTEQWLACHANAAAWGIFFFGGVTSEDREVYVARMTRFLVMFHSRWTTHPTMSKGPFWI